MLVAGYDAPTQAEPAAQQMSDMGHVTGAQRRANAAATDHFAIVRDRLDGLHGEAARLAQAR